MSLLEEALLLQRAAHDLMYLGMDGSPIYSDDLSRRNSEVYRLTTTLYNSGTWGTTVEEQANVCLALLKGYSAAFIDHGEKPVSYTHLARVSCSGVLWAFSSRIRRVFRLFALSRYCCRVGSCSPLSSCTAVHTLAVASCIVTPLKVAS